MEEIQDSNDLEKVRKSTNHIGTIMFIVSIIWLLGSIISLIFSTLFYSNVFNIFPDEIMYLFNQSNSSLSISIIYSIISLIIPIIILLIANKLKKDELNDVDQTFRSVLFITLLFILNYLMSSFYGALIKYIYNSDGSIVEQSKTFSIPIFEIIILVVLIKNLISLKKLEIA